MADLKTHILDLTDTPSLRITDHSNTLEYHHGSSVEAVWDYIQPSLRLGL